MSSPHEDSPVASSPIRRSPPTRSNCTAEVRDRLAAPFLALAVLALVAGGCGGSASEDLTQSVSEASSSGGGGGAAGAASLRLSSGTVTAGGSITGTVTLSSSA